MPIMLSGPAISSPVRLIWKCFRKSAGCWKKENCLGLPGIERALPLRVKSGERGKCFLIHSAAEASEEQKELGEGLEVDASNSRSFSRIAFADSADDAVKLKLRDSLNASLFQILTLRLLR